MKVGGRSYYRFIEPVEEPESTAALEHLRQVQLVEVGGQTQDGAGVAVGRPGPVPILNDIDRAEVDVEYRLAVDSFHVIRVHTDWPYWVDEFVASDVAVESVLGADEQRAPASLIAGA